MRIVVDTSILIDKLRNGHVWDQFIEGVDKDSELLLPTIVIFELFSGKSSKNSGVIRKINNFLEYFEIVGLSSQIARRAGQIYRDGVSGLQVPDYVISATALELGATVVTLNKKHFSKVPGLIVYPV